VLPKSGNDEPQRPNDAKQYPGGEDVNAESFRVCQVRFHVLALEPDRGDAMSQILGERFWNCKHFSEGPGAKFGEPPALR
jgi:hypothetical protein